MATHGLVLKTFIRLASVCPPASSPLTPRPHSKNTTTGDDIITAPDDAATAFNQPPRQQFPASCETPSLLSGSSMSTVSSTVTSSRRTSCSRRTGTEASRPSSQTLEGLWVRLFRQPYGNPFELAFGKKAKLRGSPFFPV